MVMKRLSSIFCLLVLALAPATAQQSAEPFRDPALPMEKRIDNLLSLMTLDEKINRLGTRTGVPRLGVPNFGSSEGIHGLQQRGGGNSQRSAITTTQFPQPPGMGESWDPEMVRQAGGVEGYEARFITQTEKYHRQILMLWGPQADLARDPRWGRSEEVYGEDPFFNGTMVVAFTKGLQGDDPKYWQSAALLKHFLGNSNEIFRTSSSSDFDQRLFWEYYSVPFRMGFLEGGAKGVMASYNAWNGTPMAINPVLKSIVQKQWGVDVLSSDGGAVKQLVTSHKRFATQQQAVVACLKAGINQFLDTYIDETKAAVRDGSVTEAEIDSKTNVSRGQVRIARWPPTAALRPAPGRGRPYPGTSTLYSAFASGATTAHSGAEFGATTTTDTGGGIYQDIAASTSAGQTVCGSAWVQTEAPATRRVRDLRPVRARREHRRRRRRELQRPGQQ